MEPTVSFFSNFASHFSVKRQLFRPFSSKYLYALDKLIQSKCKFLVFQLLAWKLTKFLMSFFNPQVSFCLNFGIPSSIMTHNCSKKFLAETVYALDKKSQSMYNFQTLGCSNDESSPNSSCHFWNHKVRVFQTLHHWSLSCKITLLYLLMQTSHTLDTNSPSEWNFWTFEWLGEN